MTIRKIRRGVALVFFVGASVSMGVNPTQAKDVYRNFAELSAAHSEGHDYHVTVSESRVGGGAAIFAPHGGAIEAGTELLAREMAKRGFGLYLFESHLCSKSNPELEKEGFCAKGKRGNLHLTSHHFDDPRALHLAAKAGLCLSLHGFGSKDTEVSVMVGGLAADAKAEFAAAIKKSLPEVKLIEPKAGLGGVHPDNIVNRCQERGVQLELSPEFRRKLRKDSVFAQKVAETLSERFLSLSSRAAAKKK